MNLAELFNHFGTDKDRVGYTPIYEALFERRRQEIRGILEIGIGTLLPGAHSSMLGFALPGYRPGGSLRAWRDHFPRAIVHGIDVQPDTQFSEERIATHRCDSTSATDVESLFASLGAMEPDVIIDDGSHVDTDQLRTLENFYPHLKRGGFYVIEDVNAESQMIRDPDTLRARCDGDPFFFAGNGTTLCVIHKSHGHRSGVAPKAATKRGASGIILMYHRINDLDVDPHHLCVPPAEFRSHMRHLADRYSVVSLERLAQGLLDGTLRPDSVAVTFDDGTLDSLELASPILMELGIPATFFVNTERIDEEHEPWWDVLARILLGDDETPRELGLEVDRSAVALPTADPRERAAAYAALRTVLMRATRPERGRILDEIIDWSGRRLPPRREHRLLLPAEIRQLAEKGHGIGAHSVSHLWLPSQPPEEQDWEIAASRRELEHIVGSPVTLFAYPYGAHDHDIVDRVRTTGFRAAVTTEPGIASFGTDVHALPRIEARSSDLSGFARALEQALAA